MAMIHSRIELYGKVKLKVTEHPHGIGASVGGDNMNIFVDHENWEAIQKLADVLKEQHDKAEQRDKP